MQTEAILRSCWLLYSDANTRFNLLADECNHLQETIYALIPETSSKTFGLAESLDVEPDIQAAREWLPPSNSAGVRDDRYVRASAQERALRNLWMTMGALATSIEANKEEFRSTYRRLIETQNPRKTETLYWFIAQRAHFLNTVFPEYLQQVQHAHQKLVALVENMPGSLPGPTLLRRWSSGGYGELLSEYSRHVHWRTQDIFWACCVEGRRERERTGDAAFNEWRREQYLTHTWAHVHTSRMATRRLKTGADQGGVRLAMTWIWSSYFYLEQPALFPLLYHECAHQYLDRGAFQASQTHSSAREEIQGGQLWFDRAEETAELLRRVSNFPEPEVGAWKTLVGEIWVDAVSIALAGEGYVFALALQLTGFDGSIKAFSDYDTNVDVRCPVDESGQWKRRIYQVHYPEPTASNLWEARLLLAIRLHQLINCQDQEQNLSGSLRDWQELIAAWHESGAAAMSEASVSRNHEDFWNYRVRVNGWVRDVIWSQIREFAEHLRQLIADLKDGNQYSLDAPILQALETAVSGYADSRLFRGARSISLNEKATTLDDICFRIRAAIGNSIVSDMGTRDCAEWFKKWAVAYADLMRNDGSAAFRLGAEHIGILRDVVRTAAWLIEEGRFSRDLSELDDHASLPEHERRFIERLRNAIREDAKELEPSALEYWSQRLNLTQTLRHSKDKAAWPALAEFLDKYRSEVALQLAGRVNGEMVDVGTFTLGVLRPEYIGARAATGDQGVYGEALRELKDLYGWVSEARRKELEKYDLAIDRKSSGGKSGVEFFALFGEYGYAVFEEDFTPVEKDVVPPKILPCIAKSRAVVRVARREGSIHQAAETRSVRVAQIAFKYRWQWIELASVMPPASDLYISSAWEDVLLVSEHTSQRDHREEMNRLGVRLRAWLDIHSSLGLADLPQVETRASDSKQETPVRAFEEKIHSIVSSNECGDVHERTGRYDAEIVWAASSPQELWSLWSKLPREFWSSISSIATSFSRRLGDESNYVVHSQVMKRHDI